MKKVIVDVYGGIGNQIFQYVFAKHLESKGYEVKISTSYNKVHNNKKVISRKTILEPTLFGFCEVDYYYKTLFKFFDTSIYKSFDKNKKLIYLYRKFYWHNEKNFDLENFRSINRVTGHWQYIELLIEYKNYVINSLINIFEKPHFLQISSIEEKVAIHVRRGDYVGLSRNLPISYYENSLNLLEKKLNNFEFEVFSDDIEWAKSQNVFKNANKFWEYKDGEKNNLRDFNELFKFKHFVISNSTFSLIPAIINSTFNGIVTYPTNWMSKEIKKINNENWLSVDYE